MKTLEHLPAVAWITVLILLTSLLVQHITVYNVSEMDAVKFGIPLTFITQDQQDVTESYAATNHSPFPFPYTATFRAPQESPTTISELRLILSFIMIALPLTVAFWLYEKLRQEPAS